MFYLKNLLFYLNNLLFSLHYSIRKFREASVSISFLCMYLQLKTKPREKVLQPRATDALRFYFPLSLGFRLLIVTVHLT